MSEPSEPGRLMVATFSSAEYTDGRVCLEAPREGRFTDVEPVGHEILAELPAAREWLLDNERGRAPVEGDDELSQPAGVKHRVSCGDQPTGRLCTARS